MRDVYFPRLNLTFTHRENPMAIITSLEKFYVVLRQELLFFWQFTDEKYNLNDK